MRILDVGCGDEVHYVDGVNEVVHLDLSREAFCLELVADGFVLPFGEGVFDVVHLSHVLEHVKNPYALMFEVKRVCCGQVVVRVPNSVYYRYFSLSDDHIFGWSLLNLYCFCRRFFRDVRVYGGFRLVGGRLSTLKTYLLGLFLRERNELVAFCSG